MIGGWTALALCGAGMAGIELHGRRQGWLAALLLVGCVGLLQWAHHASPAVLAMAAFAWQLYALALARRRALPAGVVLGLSWLVLWLGATWGEVIPAVLVALLLPVFSSWRRGGYMTALLVAAVISLPLGLLWPVYLHQHAPEAFALWWGGQSLGSYVGMGAPRFFHQPGYLYSIAAWFAFPVLPLAGWTLWLNRSRLDGSRWQLLLVQLSVILVWLVLAGDPTEVQALLLLVPLALLAAAGVDDLRRGAASSFYWFGMATFVVVALVLWGAWLALWLGWPASLVTRLQHWNPVSVAAPGVGVLFAFAVSIAWMRSLPGKRPQGYQAVISWVCGLVWIWCLAVGLWQSWLDVPKSYRLVGDGVRQVAVSVPGCVATERLGLASQSAVAYFSGLTLRDGGLVAAQSCPLVLVQGRDPESAYGQLLWQGARPGDGSERFFLYRRIVP
jgi:hypothetical protein